MDSKPHGDPDHGEFTGPMRHYKKSLQDNATAKGLEIRADRVNVWAVVWALTNWKGLNRN